ncbi:hypothetical protein HDC92_004322 [Pedobacter sp. AK017]|uniref:hypothetical protein n=1 Tax=Pedobacter sp. AK017 TaxID=2723073 RepID=UPI0016214A15|nr:hypothetical protein [Pedobacter sp. AK017]MBB5440619.1 hypothetical protein [Pedobacter sp. AK017]
MTSQRSIKAVNLLDIALNELKDSGPFADETSQQLKNSEIDKKLIARAWQHLEKDGLAYTEKKQDSPNHFTNRIYITLEGILAIEACPSIYKGRPYKWKEVKANLATTWKVASLIAVIINALIIIIFTYLTYIKPT